jgi:hypothetical protein
MKAIRVRDQIKSEVMALQKIIVKSFNRPNMRV